MVNDRTLDAREAYDILRAVCRADDSSLRGAYRQMRELLELLCRTQTEDDNLQMTDLAARINYVGAKLGLSVVEQNRLHSFRLTSNDILNHRAEPEREHLLRDAKTLAFFVRRLTREDIPEDLYSVLPRADATYIVAPPAKENLHRLRATFLRADDTYLYIRPTDVLSDEPLRVRRDVPQVNEEFNETCRILWPGAQLNLLDVAVDEAGVLTPSFIVLEPDYLIDISTLAECCRMLQGIRASSPQLYSHAPAARGQYPSAVAGKYCQPVPGRVDSCGDRAGLPGLHEEGFPCLSHRVGRLRRPA